MINRSSLRDPKDQKAKKHNTSKNQQTRKKHSKDLFLTKTNSTQIIANDVLDITN